MSRPRDYEVRVWGDAVFIQHRNNDIEYNNAHDEWDEYLKINANDEATYENVTSLCNSISTQLIELNNILNDINEENGE